MTFNVTSELAELPQNTKSNMNLNRKEKNKQLSQIFSGNYNKNKTLEEIIYND